MNIQNLKEELESQYGGYAIFETPYFNEAIIGITSSGQLIYSYDKMVESLAKEYISEGDKEDVAYENAIEFIEYNTLRTLPYMGEFKPVILYNLDSIIE